MKLGYYLNQLNAGKLLFPTTDPLQWIENQLIESILRVAAQGHSHAKFALFVKSNDQHILYAEGNRIELPVPADSELVRDNTAGYLDTHLSVLAEEMGLEYSSTVMDDEYRITFTWNPGQSDTPPEPYTIDKPSIV